MKKTIILLLISLLFSYSNLSYAYEEGPDKVVKQTVERVLSILKDKGLKEEEKKYMAFNIIKEHVSFKDMSRRILASNWKIATEKQKEEFMSHFQNILLNKYWRRMKRYSNERIEHTLVSYDNENVATVEIRILITKDDVEIPVAYRMKKYLGVWLAYDINIEGLSLVQSHRSKYKNIIKNDGVDGLLEIMWREANII